MKRTLDHYLDNMQYARGIANATRKAYANDLTQFLIYAQKKQISHWSSITREILIQYIDHLHRHGFAEASLLRNMASIRGFFKWMLDEGIISQNPSDAFVRTRHHQRLPFTLSEDELIPLIEAIDSDNPIDLRDRAILELLYGCGLRCSELIHLSLRDVQKQNNTLRIQGKGNKERIVPYGPPAAKALHRYLLWRQTFAEKYKRGAFAADLLSLDAPMFLTMTGKRLHRSHLSTIIRTRIRAFLPEGTHATPHTLRHAFATHLLNHGAPLIDISELLGHANVGVTEIYTHVSDQHLKDEFNRCFPRS